MCECDTCNCVRMNVIISIRKKIREVVVSDYKEDTFV